MPKQRTQITANRSRYRDRQFMLTCAVIAVLAFIFLSALAVFGVAAFRCVAGSNCTQLESLGDQIMAWAGAVIGTVTGILLGRRPAR